MHGDILFAKGYWFSGTALAPVRFPCTVYKLCMYMTPDSVRLRGRGFGLSPIQASGHLLSWYHVCRQFFFFFFFFRSDIIYVGFVADKLRPKSPGDTHGCSFSSTSFFFNLIDWDLGSRHQTAHNE